MKNGYLNSIIYRPVRLWSVATLFFLTFFLVSSFSQAQVSGIVFKDFNANGTKDNSATYNEVGMAGIIVKATNPSGTALTVAYTGGGSITNGTGGYTVSGGTLGQIRLEFVMPDNYTFASKGATGGTTIVFPSGATQNLAVNSPDDYWDNATQPTPQLIVPCYVNGTITNPGSTSHTGIAQLDNSQNGAMASITINEVAKASETGTVWGEAFQKSKKRMFFSSFLKRQAGFGPRGAGGIYIAEPNGSSIYKITASFTLQGVTPSNSATVIDLGTVARVTSPDTDDNYLAVSAMNEPSRDLDAFAKIGTISYGDIDLDEANQKLFITNLKQNTLMVMDVSGATTSLNNATAPTLSPLVNTYNITSLVGAPNCTGGTLRVWGLKIYKGRGYLGAVCDAMSSQNQANLKGYILSFDPANISAGFTTEINLDITYRNPGSQFQWQPWANTWAQTNVPGVGNNAPTYYQYAQPIISDIEFNENGDMTIALMDRLGNQLGANNYKPLSGSFDIIAAGTISGDILQARKNMAGTWVLEGTTGVITPNFTVEVEDLNNGYGNVSGVKGEYYNDQAGDFGKEAVMGGIVKIMGTNQVISTIVDPYPPNGTPGSTYYDSGGLHWFNSTTGEWEQWAQIYYQGYGIDFGKAVGLGDLEANLTLAPIEIGNRVWNDTDNDGIQDAGETGIGGLTVTLCLASAPSTPIATATTDANGNYYFSSATGTNTTSAIYGLNTAFNTNYILKFPTTATGGLSLSTKPNQGANDLIDTDADATGKIAFTTGTAGQNNHSFDVGYVACTAPTAPMASVSPTSIGAGGSISLTSSATGTDASTSYTWAGPSTFTSTLQNPTTTAPATAGGYTYSVTISNGGTCSVSATTSLSVTAAVACTAVTGASITINPVSPAAGTTINLTANKTDAGTPTTYTWAASSASGFTSTTSQATLTNPTIGTYNFTVTIQNNNGTGTCTATATSSLSVSVAAAVCSLYAPPITFSSIGFAPGSAPQPENVTTNNGGNILPESNVAGFLMTPSVGTDFYAFCTQISQPILPLQNPYTHELNGTTNGFSASSALRIAQLVQAAGFNATTGFGAGNNTMVNFVAMQLAVWNALYDTDYSVSTGTFHSVTDNNGAKSQANTWLLAAQNIAAPSALIHNLYNTTGQDLLMTGEVPPVSAIAIQPSCGGANAPNNGGITVSGFTTGQRYQYSSGTSFDNGNAIPASITAIPAGGVITNTLSNTTSNYTVRFYDSIDNNCYVDRTIFINAITCISPCTTITGAAISLSPVSPVVAGTTVNLTASKTDAGTPTTYTWAASPTGGFTSTTQNATLTNPIAGTYNFTVTVQNTSGTGTCTATATSSLSVTTGATIYDLMLQKTVNTTTVTVGGTATFVISVTNQGTGAATGVKVTDTFTPSTGFAITNATASVGTFTQATGIWDIGTVAIGATVNLSITVTVSTCGVLFNTAEITAMNETDIDSSPNNAIAGEDDISRACTSAPCTICPGETYISTVPNTYTNVKWFKDGGASAIATGNTYNITTTGSYTYTADNVTCPATGCCAIVVNAGSCCAISATLSQSACNNNGTPTTVNKGDDYFNVTVSATNGTSTGNFEVLLNATVVGSGQYGTNVVVSGVSGRFKADGTTTYTLTIRDQTTTNCSTTKTTTAVTSCSTACPPQLCPIVTGVKN
jgi:uncharacterized repeat protein (TIGR01451 family)